MHRKMRIMIPTPQSLSQAEISALFINSDPTLTWEKVATVVRLIDPKIDLDCTQNVFKDALRLFNGTYPGFSPITTPYHDLRHTLDVFICAARLLHGVHLSGNKIDNDDVNLVLIAALLHDVGYAQFTHETTGSGAQHLLTHIQRGIDFMEMNLPAWEISESMRDSLSAIIQCTDMRRNLSHISFPNSHIQLLGKVVGSADLVGQMADRAYLEKLLLLYLEFKEADFGNYQNVHDLLKRTRNFYEYIQHVLDSELGGIYRSLALHFGATLNIQRNFYAESMERNILYLDKVISSEESAWLTMLKRHKLSADSKKLTV